MLHVRLPRRPPPASLLLLKPWSAVNAVALLLPTPAAIHAASSIVFRPVSLAPDAVTEVGARTALRGVDQGDLSAFPRRSDQHKLLPLLPHLLLPGPRQSSSFLRRADAEMLGGWLEAKKMTDFTQPIAASVATGAQLIWPKSSGR